jgi:hypothetical protein
MINRVIVCIALFALLTLQVCSFAADDVENQGFLERPPVFIYNEPDFPLTLIGAFVPPAGKIVPAFDSIVVSSDAFNSNGTNVQPGLDVKFYSSRVGGLVGFKDGWAAGISIPWQKTQVNGTIGGFAASNHITAIGDTALMAKKRLWRGCRGEQLVFTAGLEVPTGKDDARFDQSNAATNGYYANSPQRLPISWQTGSGSLSGYLSLAYGGERRRLSYEGLIATKLHTAGDDDVKIGDIFILAGTGTYGISKEIAFSLGATLRVQGNDDYPNLPLPVEQLPLLGTTTHGTTLYLDPSIRFVVFKKLVVGVGWRYPIMKPDDGFVPDTRGFFIIYPMM